jgi:hypothetical protein
MTCIEVTWNGAPATAGLAGKGVLSLIFDGILRHPCPDELRGKSVDGKSVAPAQRMTMAAPSRWSPEPSAYRGASMFTPTTERSWKRVSGRRLRPNQQSSASRYALT